MSKEARNSTKRGQALNDATQGQFGTQPRPEPQPNVERKDQSKNDAKDVRKSVEHKRYYLDR